MRFVFLLILLAGVVLGVGTPWAVNNFSGREIGTWRAYDRATGFRPVQANLTAADEPVRILVDLTSLGTPRFSSSSTVLTLTVASNGRTALAETLTFAQSKARESAPQLQDRIFRADAGPLTGLQDGLYTFTLGFGDAEGIDTRAVDITLRAGAVVLDQRLQPLGLALIAVGFIGVVLASRRRKAATDPAPAPEPAPPRWGRDADKT